MTPEQIRKLPDKELDALVAREVMGWEFIDPQCPIWLFDDDGEPVWDTDTWEPTNDATQALEALRHAGWEWNLWMDSTSEHCDLFDKTHKSSAASKTIERAISEALVLAAQKKEPT